MTNTGSVPVLLNGAGEPCGSAVPCISGAHAKDFHVLSVTGCQKGTPIPPGSACTFDVTFIPSTKGPESAHFYVGDNAAGSPQRVSMKGQAYAYVRTSSTVFKEITSVPLSIFNSIGIKSTIPVTAFTVMQHQPAFRYGTVAGAFSFTAEWCPYCAATRWGLIVALSRFGRFNKLYDMTSSPSDYARNSPTFTFYMSTYTSSFLVFHGYEVEGPTEQPHMKLPPSIMKLVDKYNASQSFPFIDIANTAFLTGSAWDPKFLSNQSRDAVAAGLSDPSQRLTKAIVAEANYISSAICAVDGERPAKVCTSPGVEAADKAQRLPK